MPAEVLALEDVEVRHGGCSRDGWPAKVEPWANIAVPSAKGSKTRSEAIIPPIGTYAEVRALATVTMSGW